MDTYTIAAVPEALRQPMSMHDRGDRPMRKPVRALKS